MTRCCARSSPARYTRLQLIKWLGLRARSRKDQGLGPEASVLKLAASRRLAYDGDLVLAAAGRAVDAFDDDAIARRLLAAAVPRASGAAGSVAEPSRSSATSSASACSACRASPASTKTCRSASSPA